MQIITLPNGTGINVLQIESVTRVERTSSTFNTGLVYMITMSSGKEYKINDGEIKHNHNWPTNAILIVGFYIIPSRRKHFE